MAFIDRRSFLLQCAGGAAVISHARASRRVEARQFHNQPESSPLHKALTGLWSAVKLETNGEIDVRVFPQNNGIAGSDPAALKLLQEGELEFYTVMGGILSNIVPAMDVQGLPYVYSTTQQIFALDDGALGRRLDAECRAKGIERVRGGLFANGFRQLDLVNKAVHSADDMAGLKIRVPDGEMFRDFFTTVGATPVTLNINKLYDALKDRSVDGQENPLVIVETNKLYEVTRYVSMTNHMWSGFNLLAHGAFWDRLPEDARGVIERNVATFVAEQRRVTQAMNDALEAPLRQRGLQFNTADAQSFRRQLGDGFYARWKTQLGAKTWELLEQDVGRVG